MALVLDTDTIPGPDRAEALNASFANTEVPQAVAYAPAGPVRHQMELFSLGPGTHLLRNVGTGLHITRTSRHVRMSAPEQLAVCLQTRGRGLLAAGEASTVCSPGQLRLLDTTRPYTYHQTGYSDHKVLLIDPGQLTLPAHVIRAAIPAPQASPLYGLVQAHFARLGQDLAEVPPEAMAMLGRATVQLVRALITTAADDARQHEALQMTELLRITMYIDAHLHDPKLNTERIAAAHNISARQLYNVWARAGQELPPAQWIIQRRLERARNQLTDFDPQVTTIAAIAHSCGFANLSHFSQRFRAAYGMSPREWRGLSRAGT